MKVKHRTVLCLLGVLICIGVSGCGKKDEAQPDNEQEFLSQVEFSYMADADTQELVGNAMSDAGISDERQQIFFQRVDQFNSMAKEYLTDNFQTADIAKLPLYDPYALQDAWTLAYPNLYGYNCRITAYSLMADFIQVNSNAEKRDDYLVFDLLALDTDSDVFVNEQERDSFRVLFSAIPTDNTQDMNVHVKNIQETWKERDISFKNNDGVSMVSVFLHDMLNENESELIIGHVGVLLKQKNGELLFIEKVAFQEPYQVVRLANRTELNDYLMGKYDISYGQETAHPIIFENDKLLEGYRINPNNTDKDSPEAMDTTQEEQKDDEISTFSGTLEEKKDSMFIITDEDGEAYSIGFEEAPEGYDELSEGDKVVMEYTGELSVVDAFTGEIISLKRAE